MAKIVITSTHGKDDPERAHLPFAVANAALTFENEVIVFLQGQAVNLAKKEYTEGLTFPPFPPISKLITDFLAAGGKLYLCGPCLKAHMINETDIIEGAKPAGAAFLVQEAIGATVFNY